MDREALAQTLRGVGAWFSGNGPQYQRNQALMNRYAQEDDEKRLKAQREKAASLVNRIYTMNSQYGMDGAKKAIQDSVSEWKGTDLEPAVRQYGQLIQAQDKDGFEMELMDDYVKFGGQPPEQKAVPYQKTGAQLVKDEAGNLFISSGRFDPSGGALEGVLAHISGDPSIKPAGQLSLVDSIGNTAAERPGQKNAEAFATNAADNVSEVARGYFERSQALKEGLGKYDEVLAAINAGASTGKLQSFLPSIREETIAIENLQRSLGLDIINNTTFGALQNEERKMALQTGLPLDLPPEALADWVVRKKAVNKKIIDYLDWAVTELDRPGMSLGRFTADVAKGDLVPPTFDIGRQPTQESGPKIKKVNWADWKQ